jgi:1,4-alpha-glucan branching enzyme
LISKSYSKTGRKCRVTFKVAPSDVVEAKSVHVLGDFNGWDPEATPLQPRKSGAFSATTSVESGYDYRFRYLVDGERWISDSAADGLVPNRFGDLDSVLEVEAPGS